MPRIPEIPYSDVESLRGECIHPAKSVAQADLYELQWEGGAAILKDFSGRPWWIRHSMVRIVMGREFRALRRLQGVEGIPRLLGRAGPNAILLERLSARRLPRNRETPPPLEYFDRVQSLVGILHEKGIGHGDLRRLNILIDARNRPYLIDFATSCTAKPGVGGLISRFLFRRMVEVDLTKLARIRSEFYPEALTPEQTARLESPPAYLRLARLFKKNVLHLRKRSRRKQLAKRIRDFFLGDS